MGAGPFSDHLQRVRYALAGPFSFQARNVFAARPGQKAAILPWYIVAARQPQPDRDQPERMSSATGPSARARRLWHRLLTQQRASRRPLLGSHPEDLAARPHALVKRCRAPHRARQIAPVFRFSAWVRGGDGWWGMRRAIRFDRETASSVGDGPGRVQRFGVVPRLFQDRRWYIHDQPFRRRVRNRKSRSSLDRHGPPVMVNAFRRI